jgi:hypothetical protein
MSQMQEFPVMARIGTSKQVEGPRPSDKGKIKSLVPFFVSRSVETVDQGFCSAGNKFVHLEIRRGC